MNLGLPQIKIKIAPFTDSPGQVKYSYTGFKSKPKSCSKISIIHICVLAVVASPSPIGKCIKIGVLTNEVAKLCCSYHKL